MASVSIKGRIKIYSIDFWNLSGGEECARQDRPKISSFMTI